jgi:hypothetical protein
MAKRIFGTSGVSFAAVATGTISAGPNYMAMIGSSTTQITDILEVLITGTASASTIGAFRLAPIGTAATAPSALASPNGDGPMQSGTTPVANTTFITVGTTQPTNSAAITAPRINLGLNTFGGILRWNAAPTQQYTLVGNTVFAAGLPVTFGQCILYNDSSGTGATTTANAQIIYEPY